MGGQNILRIVVDSPGAEGRQQSSIILGGRGIPLKHKLCWSRSQPSSPPLKTVVPTMPTVEGDGSFHLEGTTGLEGMTVFIGGDDSLTVRQIDRLTD